jgi:hypothetical protein
MAFGTGKGFFEGLSICRLDVTDCAILAGLEPDADRQGPNDDFGVGAGVLRHQIDRIAAACQRQPQHHLVSEMLPDAASEAI